MVVLGLALWVAGRVGWSHAEEQTFRLANGGQISGELLNPDESPRVSYQIKTPWGVVTLSASQVTGLVELSEAERWYQEHRPTGELDIQGHLKMAAECAARGLEAQRAYHLEQVLKLDPDHEDARKALGYTKVDGRWVRTDEWYRRRGYVRYQGSWRLPQEVMVLKEEAERQESQGKWNRQLRQWRQWIVKNHERAAEAVAGFRNLEDPAAAEVLIRMLAEPNEPVPLRRLYLEGLGRLPGAAVTYELVKRALSDPDAQIRETATEQLARRQDRAAVHILVGMLEKYAKDATPVKENVVVNRVAAVLGRLKAAEATLPLINVLVTKHKQTISQGGGNLNPTFSSGGGGGLTVGNTAKTIVGEIENPSVRDALIAIHGGAVNFGFDVRAWRAWFEQQRMPVVLDLRRDP